MREKAAMLEGKLAGLEQALAQIVSGRVASSTSGTAKGTDDAGTRLSWWHCSENRVRHPISSDNGPPTACFFLCLTVKECP